MIKPIEVQKPIVKKQHPLTKIFDDLMEDALPINTWYNRQQRLLKGKKF